MALAAPRIHEAAITAAPGEPTRGLRMGYRLVLARSTARALACLGMTSRRWRCSRRRLPLGDPNAETNVAVMYLQGRSVARDPAEAVRWLRLSAAKGEAHGERLSGRGLSQRRGVAPDKAQAMEWLEEGGGARATNWQRKRLTAPGADRTPGDQCDASKHTRSGRRGSSTRRSALRSQTDIILSRSAEAPSRRTRNDLSAARCCAALRPSTLGGAGRTETGCENLARARAWLRRRAGPSATWSPGSSGDGHELGTWVRRRISFRRVQKRSTLASSSGASISSSTQTGAGFGEEDREDQRGRGQGRRSLPDISVITAASVCPAGRA